MKLEEKAIEILKEPICNSCLGRNFAGLLSGYSNEERGRIIRSFVAFLLDSDEKIEVYMNNFYDFKFRNLKVTLQKPERCKICKNFFREKLEEKANEVIKKLKGIEFDTFQLGTIPSNEMANEEEKLVDEIGGDFTEPIKTEINREIGKIIEKKTSKTFSAKNPDVTIILDLQNNRIKTEIRSLYVFGKYQKLKRGIPQTKWICPDCNGKGCIKCKGIGKLYKTSVQEEIEKNFLKAAESKKSKFHGCVDGKTQILLNESNLKMEELCRDISNHEVITYNFKRKSLAPSKIASFMKLNISEIKLKTFEISTKETGRKIIATEDHPFFTQKGLISLNKIVAGDKVAVLPHLSAANEKAKELVLVGIFDIFETIKKYITPSNGRKIVKELENKQLLPLTISNHKISILTKLLGFNSGDGTATITRKRDVRLEFYENKQNLKKIQSDIKKLGFNSKIYRKSKKKRVSQITDYFGNIQEFESNENYSLCCYSKSLWCLLVSLGAPVGDKITNKFEIPLWVFKSPKNIKKEYVSALFGSEMNKPRLDKRKYNKKSFNTPRFSINKLEIIKESGLFFINQLRKLLLDFRIETLEPRIIPYSTRKDGKSVKLILDIKNKYDNLLNLYGQIGYSYNVERNNLSKIVLGYLQFKKRVVELRKKLYSEAILMKQNGFDLNGIYKKLGNEYLSYKNLALWLSPKSRKFTHIKVPNGFPNFDDWMRQATKGLDDGLIWETIESKNERKTQFVYDITTAKDTHNFFANGFLVSNSGREDIDARNLDWRPFVIELVKPAKRKIDLKKIEKTANKSKKVKIKNLKVVDKDLVNEIKFAKIDKTYAAEVIFSKNIDKKKLKELKKLNKTVIMQQTPTRVVHRRANIIRKRMLKQISWKLVSKKKIVFKIRGESGLYIKELITGDEGRTKPNISEILGNKVNKISLDVIKIHAKGI